MTGSELGASPGEVDLVATVDATSVVVEADERNHTRTQALTVHRPTIEPVVTESGVAPAPVVRGRPAPIAAELRDRGNSPAGGSATRVKTTWFAPGLTTFVPVLDPGQEIRRPFAVTLSISGTFTIDAFVDSTGAAAETNELDDGRRLPVGVEPHRSEREVPDVDVVPVSPGWGPSLRTDNTVIDRDNDPVGLVPGAVAAVRCFGPTSRRRSTALRSTVVRRRGARRRWTRGQGRPHRSVHLVGSPPPPLCNG